MSEVILASGKNINKFTCSSRNFAFNPVSKSYALKARNSFVSFDFSCVTGCSKIIFKVRRISGNGVAFVECNNFVKKVIISNVMNIETPYVNQIKIFKNDECLGEFCILSIIGVFDGTSNINKENMNIRLFNSSCDNYRPETENKFKLYTAKKDRSFINSNIPIGVTTTYINSEGTKYYDPEFATKFNNFINTIQTIPETEFVYYGGKNKVLCDINNIILDVFFKIQNINIEPCNYLFVDYAGLGDSIHTRLTIQQLSKLGKICWILPPLTFSLFADDDIATTYEGFTVPYRSPNTAICKYTINFIHSILVEKFKNYNIIDVPYNILNFFLKNPDPNPYYDFFFRIHDLIREPKIKHKLSHNGDIKSINSNLVDKKYIVIEYSSYSFGTLNVSVYDNLINKMKENGIETVYIGASNSPPLNYGIDCRGLSSYDTFSLIKNSIGMLGRNSGNQCLSVFCPHIPVFEISAPATLNWFKYRENINSLSIDEFETFILNYYKLNNNG